jgi:hypothetical protein
MNEQTHDVFSRYEYHVIVTRCGNINTFRVLDDGSVSFWKYAQSIPQAISLCPGNVTVFGHRIGGL